MEIAHWCSIQVAKAQHFLMSVYVYLAHTVELSHKELLSIIWGFDISPFAEELAMINLWLFILLAFNTAEKISIE